MVAGFRLVFFGTPAFAVPSLERLVASGHRVVAVVTQPDRPRGRGLHATASPVKQVAIDRGIEVAQPEKLRDAAFLDVMAQRAADLGIVVAYGKILPKTLLDLPRLGFLNVHASLLPKYRGAAPVQRAVIAGEPETGVTIMRVVPELDAGPMLAVGRRPISPDETSDVVERDLSTLGADLLLRTIDALAVGPVPEAPQDDAMATYASRLTKEEALIDWDQPAARLHDFVRGLHPWPLAFWYLGKSRLTIRETRVDDGPYRNSRVDSTVPGTVVEAHGDTLRVATGEGGTIEIVELQPEGKRALTAREFLAGHSGLAGHRFQRAPDPQ